MSNTQLRAVVPASKQSAFGAVGTSVLPEGTAGWRAAPLRARAGAGLFIAASQANERAGADADGCAGEWYRALKSGGYLG